MVRYILDMQKKLARYERIPTGTNNALPDSEDDDCMRSVLHNKSITRFKWLTYYPSP